jgi:catechol 2,3-dioxygenase-like lactoylglutathione lyase family enzyme
MKALPMLTAAEPSLYVTDFDAACAFFAEKLGFEIVFTYGEPPFYGQVRRDLATLNLRLIHGPVFVGDIRESQELLAASITVGGAKDLAKLFVELQSAGVDFFRPLKLEPWGARTFIVRDPDGNLLLFAGMAN